MKDVYGLVAEAEESLKGRLHPAEILVSNESLVQSSRTQNKTLLLINEKLDGVQLSLSNLECDINARVDAVQARVDDWGKRLAELEASVQRQHDAALAEQERVTRDVDGFKTDTQVALGEVKDSVKVLDTALKSLPKTIKVSVKTPILIVRRMPHLNICRHLKSWSWSTGTATNRRNRVSSPSTTVLRRIPSK